jgi:hypothetical protein
MRQCGARRLTQARSFGPCWRPSLSLKPTPVYLQCRVTDAAPIRDGRARAACHGNSFEQRHLDAGQHADRGAADDAEPGVESWQVIEQRLTHRLEAPGEGRDIPRHAKNAIAIRS